MPGGRAVNSSFSSYSGRLKMSDQKLPDLTEVYADSVSFSRQMLG
jgi:hypothetical protein